MLRKVGLCFFLVSVGCVSDPVVGDAGPKEGKLDGACHDNGTCDDGLVCVAGLKRCGPPSDAAATDGNVTDAPSDSDADANPCAIPGGGGIKCPNAGTCAPGSASCCMKNNSGTCAVDCMNLTPDFIWRCDRKADCSGMNGECCVDNPVITNGGMCTLLVSNSMGKGTYCTMNSKCSQNTAMLCNDDTECTGSMFGNKCIPTQFTNGGDMKVVGLCRN